MQLIKQIIPNAFPLPIVTDGIVLGMGAGYGANVPPRILAGGRCESLS